MSNKMVNVGIIGAGTMGAIVAKRFATNRRVQSITVLDPFCKNKKELARVVSKWYQDQYEEFISTVDVLVLAIKPQDFAHITPRLRDSLRPVPNSAISILSIMAGVSLQKIAHALDTTRPIARMMPSIAAQYGKAMVALACSEHVNQQQHILMNELGQSLGEVIELPERSFDAFIALSGSGIAFGLQIIQAFTLGGVEAGLTAETAERIVLKMFDGATTMLRRSKHNSQQLIRNICSPGGTTIAGIATLERCGLNATLMEAVRATIAKSQSLLPDE